MRALFVAAIMLFGASAQAQFEERVPLEEAVAQTIVNALPPASWDDSWAYDWSALGSRLANDTGWHLIGPEPNTEITNRTGWTRRGHVQAGIGACGRDQVTGLSFHLPRQVDHAREGLLDALRTLGADVSERGDGVYAVTPPGRDAALLAFSGGCTSPMSRAAQRCWADVRLAFREENPNGPVMLACRAP